MTGTAYLASNLVGIKRKRTAKKEKKKKYKLQTDKHTNTHTKYMKRKIEKVSCFLRRRCYK